MNQNHLSLGIWRSMDKNGDNLELQTLLNEKHEEQVNDGGKQKKSSPANGKNFLKGILL